MSNPVNIFISYTHTDEAYKIELTKHFVTLERNRQVKIWSDSHIEAGIEIWNAIDSAFNKSDIFLPLISINYLTSKSCISGELEKALSRRMQDANFRIIPIILGHCGWHQFEKLGTYKALPKDGKPISTFDSHDEAYYQIVDDIDKIISKKHYSEKKESPIPEEKNDRYKTTQTILTENRHNSQFVTSEIPEPLKKIKGSFAFYDEKTKRWYGFNN